MKNDLKDSAIKSMEELALSLKVVREDLIKLTNYERTLTKRIIETCEIYGIENEELDKLQIGIEATQLQVPLKDLFDIFPNYDIKTIVDNIVAEIKIDTHATEQNLRFSANFAEPIISAVMKQLKELTNISTKKVELK